MRPLRDMDTIQIEVTNACVMTCSNCTRFCGHHKKPFFMTFEQFTQAVDSLVDFPNMVGVMGGEPLLHPEFERFCKYLQTKVPPQRAGLWSTFPPFGKKYAQLITETFWNVLLNDHTNGGMPHAPLLLNPRDYMSEEDSWYAIHHCRFQNAWSASITPKGAYFCEVAAALDIILDLNRGWPVVPGWWKRSPNHYIEQMEAFCTKCGGSLRGEARTDTEEVYDVSPWWLAKLKEYGSPMVRKGEYRIYEGPAFSDNGDHNKFRHLGPEYFAKIADKYGLKVIMQPTGFLRPVMA